MNMTIEKFSDMTAVNNGKDALDPGLHSLDLAEATTYERPEICWFRKTAEAWGEFSNMHGGFPLLVNGVSIYTSEHLYQACKLPSCPDVQHEILSRASPMGAKMCAKKHKEDWRADWEQIKLDLMRWCLRLKFALHVERLSRIVDAANDYAIVEDSVRDRFWGAVPQKDNPDILVGQNVLGKMWMELRAEWHGPSGGLLANVPAPPMIPDLLLFGTPIRVG
jgi:ribA/ribD-fused uncharacterized protein